MKHNGADIIKIMNNGVEINKCLQNGVVLYDSGISPPAGSSEKVINGDFSGGSTGWDITGSFDFSSKAAVCTSSKAWDSVLRQWISVNENTQYTLNVGTNTGVLYINAWTAVWGTQIGSDLIQWDNKTGIITFTIPAKATCIKIDLANGSHTSGVTFDNISIKAS